VCPSLTALLTAFNRFKSQTSSMDVLGKYYVGITKTMETASGWWNMLDHHKMECLELYKQCHGNVFNFCACYKHLKDKNQFSAFWTYCKGEILGKKPIGKREARLTKADGMLVKATI
jgi:hypothetical protein